MPNWSLSIHCHIFAETIVGIAQGTRIAARTMPRPLELAIEHQRDDECRGSSRCVTEITVKRTVFQTARHQTGSTSRPS